MWEVKFLKLYMTHMFGSDSVDSFAGYAIFG